MKDEDEFAGLITEGLAAAINADSTLQNLGVTAPTNAATLVWSQQFSGNALPPSGTSAASATAVDGSNNSKTEGLQVSVKGPGTTSLTYDKNGNLTGDGTNSYKWDAANRMIEIDYAGSGNKSLFAYDGLSRNIQILEYSGGSLTSSKNFVWAQDQMRPYQPCEARDSGSSILSQYFILGQSDGSDERFYDHDHLSSVREMTDSSGNVSAQYSFDLYGRAARLQGTLDADFQYAGYFIHSRDSLDLARHRAYYSALGRWLNRDPIRERVLKQQPKSQGSFGKGRRFATSTAPTELQTSLLTGVMVRRYEDNLYSYVANDPVSLRDPSGLSIGRPKCHPTKWTPPDPVPPEITDYDSCIAWCWQQYIGLPDTDTDWLANCVEWCSGDPWK